MKEFSYFKICVIFSKCWPLHQAGELIWKKNPQMKCSLQYTTFYTQNGKEIWPKNAILPNFIQSPNIKYSTYTKTVWGELKGHFELHLAVIWGSEDQKLKKKRPFSYPMILSVFWATFQQKPSFSQQKVSIRWLKLSSSKRSHLKLQKTYLPFFYTTDTFFNIFTFRFGGR